ncbi:MAG: TonB-dependent receptor [Acidobacteria bacterium]|nr:MAG: TonB-dependent receptor [Acidobacteriota bacterium]
MPRSPGLFTLLGLVSLLVVPPAAAQETAPEPPPAKDAPSRPGEPRKPEPVAADVTVVATRLAEPAPGSTARVLTRAEIERLPVRTLPELLRYLPGVDVRRRGVEGIQADVGLRGADHNGTLLLVDGEPMNDPQTNHLTADLDVPLDAVERVEVLYGASSALWGSGAVGGVVNVVTRGAALGRARAQLEGRYAHGANSLDAGSLRMAGFFADVLSASLDADRAEWAGFRDDTELARQSVRASLRWASGAGPVDLTAGYAGRRYGAYAFYGTRYPNQQETTRTRTARLSAELSLGGWTLSPSASIRAHHDDFVLERGDPSFYENLHDADTFLGRLVARRDLLGGTLAVGVEAGREAIQSTNLGDHRRDRGALFVEAGRPFTAADPGRGGLRVGVRLDGWEGYDARLSPLLAAHFGAARGLTLRASIGTAFRVPTFTELYYSDPQNTGNPDLRPETALNGEVGAGYRRGPFTLDGALFVRDSEDLIDYVRYAPEEPFVATNVREATTTGVEASAFWAPRKPEGGPSVWPIRLGAQLTYLWSDLEALSEAAGGAIEGRYVLDPLRAKVDLLADVALPMRSAVSARLSYVARRGSGADGWLLGGRLGVDLLEGDILEVYVEGDDLLDEALEERRGVPAPGRIWAAGARLTW